MLSIKTLGASNQLGMGDTYRMVLLGILQKIFVLRIFRCHAESIQEPDVISGRLLSNMIGLEIPIGCQNSAKYPSIRVILPIIW
jgi:hypothetical protein